MVGLTDDVWIKSKLDEAINDAEKTRKGVMDDYEADFTLGIVFILSYITNCNKKEMDGRLKLLIENIKNVDYDLMAYCFPNHFLHNDKGYYYPGVVFITRVA